MTRTRTRHEPALTYGVSLPPPPTPAEQLAEWLRLLRESRRSDPSEFVNTLKAFRRAARSLGLDASRVAEVERRAMSGGAYRPGE